ncbi:hypothetical protein BU24DRAFT_423750 [Aaosphaeria arxii CBS 175.79]|uniref:Uncharacterized protein n=1 Tax=Aaosphaeria arxii CBS 175.79 TaxID=1450172 RepID=A0A6A5XPJ7_9PLEO|nr:uncharacterized protein BU24DRAFT_423750 [Aaosphaeria arxii CBS 175.79]KAF2014836.1 hypothetical protein BU24DRAFT_423750 [Aaosphaeria arxii CBS 175.79]
MASNARISMSGSHENQEHFPSPKLTLFDKISPFPWKAFLVIASLPLALSPIIVLATAAEEASVGYIQGRDCYPNGMWSETQGATWRIMDSSYFFTPNLSFGSMTFTQVKVIDIAWDLIVGRGGQLLLAWVNYRVFNEWLLFHLERHLTSYKLYTAVAFETTTISTLGVLGKEFLAFGQPTWLRFFRWLALLSMILSTFYVLSFPTLMAAMTGYITTDSAYIESYSKDLIELHSVLDLPVYYVIEDSSRIGYEKPLVVTIGDSELMDAVWSYVENTSSIEEFPRGRENPRYGVETGLNRTERFSLNKKSIWRFGGHAYDLDSPTLNVTWLTNVTAPTSNRIRRQFYSDEARQGDIYTGQYILSHGSCKPNDTYQWGFSYIFLFMVSIFNFIWACIMVGMWLDTVHSSRMYRRGRRPGLLRSIMDISGAIREELGQEVLGMEEKDMRKRLRESGGALLIPKSELRVTRTATQDSNGRMNWRRKLTKGSTF